MDKNSDEVNIHKAAAEGRLELCRELLGKGEDVDTTDALGWTLLMHAAHNGHNHLVSELLSRGAQVSLRSHHGITAFTIGTLKLDGDLLKTLHDNLAPELQQDESNTALLVACANGAYTAVKWILQSTTAQVNFISPLAGVTPLMLVAMTCGDCAIAELLMKSGADPGLRSVFGQDVSQLAQASGNDKLFSLLNPMSPMITGRFSFDDIRHSESVNSTLTVKQTEQLNSEDVQGDVFQKSLTLPVFKVDGENLVVQNDFEEKYVLSPLKRSVFLRSPQSWDSNLRTCQYNLAAIVSPCKFVTKTPSKGKKRKLSTVNGISSWFKKITKRRSKSLADEVDSDDMNIQQNGVDFLKMLKGLGLDEFFPIFKEQELDIWTFLSLTVQDLAAMGIDKSSSQLRILAGIQRLRTTQI